jgi:D-glycerate 3-kinase
LAPQPETGEIIANIIRQQQLPDIFALSAEQHFLPLISHLRQQRSARELRIVGINGAQGTGKSTLACLIQQVLKLTAGWNVVIVSIDDSYLTLAQRKELASRVHPLLRTRGVPGTHDIELLSNCLDGLCVLPSGSSLRIPRFDKSSDDRLPEQSWDEVCGPVDLVILEGWCVGSGPQAPEELLQPVNTLEERHDESSIWRSHVNQQLQGPYAEVFKKIDYLVHLQAPDFESVFRWRSEQEQKLRKSGSVGGSVMSDDEIAAFVQHYERLTRHNLATMPKMADVVLELDRDHQCQSSYYR